MTKFVPKSASEEQWQPLVQKIDYGILCRGEDHIYLRFGPTHGLYVEVVQIDLVWVINALDFVTGNQTLLGKLPVEEVVSLGRTGECSIKISHGMVSRQHLEMTLVPGMDMLVVHDVGSTNGTYLLKSIQHFDIGGYIQTHPVNQAQESTLDNLHEVFGPKLDDFLMSYSRSKGK